MHNTYSFVGSHGEEVGHEGGEARGEAALRDEAQLQLGQAHSVVSALPVPARDVQQVRLQTQYSQLPSISAQSIYSGVLTPLTLTLQRTKQKGKCNAGKCFL